MKEYKVSLFKLEHINELSPRDDDHELFEKFNVKEMLTKMHKAGNQIWSIFHGKELITIMGTLKTYDGVMEIYQLPNGDRIKKHVKAVKKIIIQLENHLFSQGNWRLHTICASDYKHERWMKFIGYTKEGILKKHSFNGDDLAIWAKVI